MECGNGCPPEAMAREDQGFVRTSFDDDGWQPEALYHCEECDWTAHWRKDMSLEVLFPGVPDMGRMP